MKLINAKQTRKYALEKAKAIRKNRFTRCSKKFLAAAEGALADWITKRIESLPSVGKTLMSIILLISFFSAPVQAKEVYEKYNYQTNSFELATDDEELQYNPMTDSFEYAPEENERNEDGSLEPLEAL